MTVFQSYNIFDLLNSVPDGIHVYYNKRFKRFQYHYESDLSSENLIKTPCTYEMKREFMKNFYALLSEEEYNVAKSYPFRKGYFSYLKEVGLYEIYEEAERLTKEKNLLVWMIKNNISFFGSCPDIDCRYL
jgi:hypothetical protein